MNVRARESASMRWTSFGWTAVLAMGAALLLSATPSRGGSIFDDDQTPATRPQPATQQPALPTAPPATPNATPAVPPPATPANEVVRHSVPDRASRAKCRKLFEEVYANELKDRSPAARLKLAQTLLDEAGKTAEGSPDRFVLLNGAIQAAEEGESLRMCFTAAKRLAEEYGVDELAAKADAAKKTSAVASPAGLASISNVEALMALADQLLAGDDIAAVTPIESALQRAVASIADADLKTEVKSQIRDVTARREAREKLAPAIEKLRQSPTDPAANLAVGSYVCFQTGNWDQGLPLLAKSSDAKLRGLAAAELAVMAAGKPITQAADGWFDAAPTLAAPYRPGALQHAAALYRSAEPSATGLEKLAIDKRLAQIPPVSRPGRPRHVDLLSLFDPATSVVAGQWQMQDGSLVVQQADFARVAFRYQPPTEYDFRIGYTVLHAGDEIVQICYSGGQQFTYQTGGFGNTLAAFGELHGISDRDNKSANRKDHWLSDGQYYDCMVKVRRTGVEAWLDGQLVSALKTDYSDIGLHDAWRLSRTDVIGLGAQHVAVRFETAEIIEISGEGKLLSP